MPTDLTIYTERNLETFYSEPQRVAIPNGLNIEYALHGNDAAPEKVVLIMGLMSEKEGWLPILSTLLDPSKPSSQRYQFLTFDNRGVGGTDKPEELYSTSQMADDTLALMHFLQWPKAHIVGISMGGMIAQELASRGPAHVKSLSLLVTSPGQLHGAIPHKEQLSGYWELAKLLLSKGGNDPLNAMLYTMYTDEFLDKEAAEGVTYRSILTAYHKLSLENKRMNSTGQHGQYAACLKHNVSPKRLNAIQQGGFPILIVGAGQDRLLHPNNSNILYEGLQGAWTKKIIFENSGHGVVVQEREAVAAALEGNFERAHNEP
ncbi:serine protease family S33 [Thraustotheca clavata]|uniref:Serine protease family S33 n=1 Tax=Thraustotheca clavata TaxID=74557 RepID=A0A1V9Y8Z6_9STRA|nr:serine protease family S33 [Thraustotheca clavata]